MIAEKKSLDEIINICKEYEEVRKSSIYNFGCIDDLIDICEKLKALGYEWGDRLIPPYPYDHFRIGKNIYIANSNTHFVLDKNKYYVQWDNGNVGRLQFVTYEYYHYVTDEWHEFEAILKSYNPVDFDDLNTNMIFEIEDGKRLMQDYPDICKKIEGKMRKKIDSKKIELKRQELKELTAEINRLEKEIR